MCMKNLKKGLVSIITPAFNSEKFIASAIESVRSQTYSNFEMLIVVDSGTTDNTANIVKDYEKKDPRIRLITITERGLALSRNKAIEESIGQYIAFLDSDDLWLPEKLERQLKFMTETGAKFSCTAYRRSSEDLKTTGNLITVPAIATYTDLLKNNTLACLTVIYDQTDLQNLKMQSVRGEDYRLWLEISRKGYDCYGLNEDLARYRFVENSLSRQFVRTILDRWRTYTQNERLNPIKATYYMLWYLSTALLKRKQF